MIQTSLLDPVAESAHARTVAERLDDLHQMLYTRGGIRPTNAAVEELSKLLLLKFALATLGPGYMLPSGTTLGTALDVQALRSDSTVEPVKEAFSAVVRLPAFAGRLPGGGTQSVWPTDEPLRITRADVIAEALDVLDASGIGSEGHVDVLGTAFDVFLRGRYDHAGGLGTYLTPHSVATMLAKMTVAELDDLRPLSSAAPTVGDPCCGTGRFLIAALQEITQRWRTEYDGDEAGLAELRDACLFGADQSASSVAKARINLMLFAVNHPQVFTVEDSLTDQNVDALRGKMRLLLTNPPFGDRKYDDRGGIARMEPWFPKLSARKHVDPALAFVGRCLDLLGDGGILGIVLPDGLVDGRALRDMLLVHDEIAPKDVSLVANVSLPTATFAPAGTVAKTSAVILRKGGSSRSTVFLARADHVGYLKQASKVVPDPAGDDLPAITVAGVEAITADDLNGSDVRYLSKAPLAALVRRADLRTADPSRVDAQAFAARRSARESGGPQLADVLSPVKSQRASRVADDTPFVSVLHVDGLGGISWHEAAVYRPTTPGQAAMPGNVLVSLLNPRKLRAAVVPQGGPIVCSAEFGVFESLAADPYEVLLLIHSNAVRSQLAPLGRGTSSSRRRIDHEDVLDVYAPAIDATQLQRLADELRRSLDQRRMGGVDAAATFRAFANAVA